jgi:hypothetical protein
MVKSRETETGWTCSKAGRESGRYRTYIQNFDEDILGTPKRRKKQNIKIDYREVFQFAGSNPAEAIGFFGAEKSSACLPSEGK